MENYILRREKILKMCQIEQGSLGDHFQKSYELLIQIVWK